MTCSRDGSAMREDLDFLRDAITEGVRVQRFVCIYGHSEYPGPPPAARGWSPSEGAARSCTRCDGPIPSGQTGYLCDHCVKSPSQPCRWCGRPTPRNRKTCSAACLSAVAAATGRRALEKLHEKKITDPRSADQMLKDHWGGEKVG